MMTVVVAIIVLFIAVGAIYLLLRSMGEDGVEVAAPGSCKSGRCGVQRVAGKQGSNDPAEEISHDPDEQRRKDTV